MLRLPKPNQTWIAGMHSLPRSCGLWTNSPRSKLSDRDRSFLRLPSRRNSQRCHRSARSDDWTCNMRDRLHGLRPVGSDSSAPWPRAHLSPCNQTIAVTAVPWLVKMDNFTASVTTARGDLNREPCVKPRVNLDSGKTANVYGRRRTISSRPVRQALHLRARPRHQPFHSPEDAWSVQGQFGAIRVGQTKGGSGTRRVAGRRWHR